MNSKQINILRHITAEKSALIHCITNPISINQCANTALAVGCRPMMAEHPAEAAEITATAGALLLNLGNITDVRMQSMQISAEEAQRKNIPFVLDAVGVACSQLRREYTKKLFHKCTPSIIKGNYSEIEALYDENYKSDGVDAMPATDIAGIADKAVKLAKKHKTVILASGKTDIVTDGSTVVFVRNGTEQLSHVTGTGCMLGTLCACYMSAGDALSAAVTACCVLGISGQLADTDKGNGSFMVNLMDNLSTLKDTDIENLLEIEVTEVE